MNYLYDILLNFNSKLYEVFEWEKSDIITHIRRIPFFKVNSKTLYELLNYKVSFSVEFISNLYKKTECFSKNKIININYAFLVTDGKEVVALNCNKNNIIGYSKLIFDEELEALEYALSLKYTNIDYSINSLVFKKCFKTRNELKIRNYIFKELSDMYKNNDYDKLRFLYLECFNKSLVLNKYTEFHSEIESNWDEVYIKLYNLLKLSVSNTNIN